jgi:hypothetical protein
LLCNHSTQIITTYTQSGIETITPTPTPENDNEPNKITHWTTTMTTVTLYVPGSTKVFTTTNDQGELTTYVTYIPPSTIIVVKKVLTPAVETIGNADSIYDYNSHGLWGVTMSLTTIAVTLVFMIFV